MGFHGNRMGSHEIHGGDMGLRSEKRMEPCVKLRYYMFFLRYYMGNLHPSLLVKLVKIAIITIVYDTYSYMQMRL